MKRRALLGFGGLAVASLLAPLVARSLAPAERSYAVDLTGDSTLSLGAAAQRLRFRLRGNLRLTEINNQQVIGKLERPEVTLWQGDDAKPAEALALQAALLAPFSLQKSAEGNIATVAFSPQAPEGARQTLRALLTFFQASSQRPGRETDLAGICEVRYSPRPDSAWEKRVLRYEAMPDSLTEQRPEGSQLVTFDTAGGVQSITGTRTLRTFFGEREVSASTLSGSIRQTARHAVSDQTSLPSLGSLEPLNAGPDAGAQQRQRYAATLGEDSATSLLAALHQLPESAPTGAANALYLKLRALLALQPETAARFDAYLAQASPASAGTRALLDALREIGTPQAQNSLATAVRTRLEDSAFTELALPALGLIAHPSKDTEALLLTLARRSDSTGNQACLLLGSLAHTLSATEPARSKALLTVLFTRLRTDTDETATLLTLAALGNAGATESLPHLLHSLEHASPRRRSATLSALRLIPDPEAERLLLSHLNSDPDTGVRASAAFALSFQPRSHVVRSALQKALSDPSKEVAEAARRALDSLPEKK